MGLGRLEIVYHLQRGELLYTSESDVYRRQNLTYKDGPRAERVNKKNLYLNCLIIVHCFCLSYGHHQEGDSKHTNRRGEATHSDCFMNICRL